MKSGGKASRVRRDLRRRGLPCYSASDTFYCQCSAFCSAWAGHPLGQRMTGDGCNRHVRARCRAGLRAEQADADEQEKAVVNSEPVAARIMRRKETPGKFLMALSGECERVTGQGPKAALTGDGPFGKQAFSHAIALSLIRWTRLMFFSQTSQPSCTSGTHATARAIGQSSTNGQTISLPLRPFLPLRRRRPPEAVIH